MSRGGSRAIYAPHGTFDQENSDGTVTGGAWRRNTPDGNMIELQRIPVNVSDQAKAVREEFENYFVTDGEIPWQYNQI